MKKTFLLPLAICSLMSFVGTAANATVLINDTFTSNGTSASYGYYLIRNAAAGVTASVTGGTGLIVDQAATGTQNTGIFKKFATTGLAVGETLTMTMGLNFNQGNSTTGDAFRIMLGSTSTTGTATNFNAFNADTLFTSLRLANGTGTSGSVRSHVAADGANISTFTGTNSVFTQGSGGIPLTNAVSSVVFSLTRTGSGIDIAGNLNGNSIGSFSRAGAEALTSYNLFGVYQNSSTPNLDFTLTSVNLQIVPEPSTWALLAGGLTALTIFRRRRA